MSRPIATRVLFDEPGPRGRARIRVLTVLDTFSRYVPALDPRFSYRGEDVVATLERVCRQIGYPKTIRVDQGSEFVSRDLDLRWGRMRAPGPRRSRTSAPSGRRLR